MKLTYRGVQYSEEIAPVSQSTTPLAKKNIVYRGNSPQGRINPRFPFVQYIKQLFDKSESKPVLDPITFWYNHKRAFLDDCLLTDNLENLNRSWNLTKQIEFSKALKPKQKTKLKYRGVTYYR